MADKHPKTNQLLYFIAMLPPDDIAEEVTAFKQQLYRNFGTKHAFKSPPHITLYMPFRWLESEEKKLTATLNATTSLTPPFSVTLDGFGCFPPRVIYVKPQPNEALQTFRKAFLEVIAHELGLPVKPQPYRPHMTIAHRDLKSNDFEQAWQKFKDLPYQRAFTARGFWLLKHDSTRWHPYQYFDFRAIND